VGERDGPSVDDLMSSDASNSVDFARPHRITVERVYANASPVHDGDSFACGSQRNKPETSDFSDQRPTTRRRRSGSEVPQDATSVRCQRIGDGFIYAFTGLFLAALALCLLWVIVLEFNVSLYALAHPQEAVCDKPLANYLLAAGCVNLIWVFLQAVVLVWALARPRHLVNRFSWVAVVFLWLVLLLLLAGVVIALAGNIWVFSSKTCRQTSQRAIPNPQSIMLSLYNAALVVVLVSDILFLLLVLHIFWSFFCKNCRRYNTKQLKRRLSFFAIKSTPQAHSQPITSPSPHHPEASIGVPRVPFTPPAQADTARTSTSEYEQLSNSTQGKVLGGAPSAIVEQSAEEVDLSLIISPKAAHFRFL